MSRVMYMKQVLKPIKLITASVPGVGDVGVGQHAVLRQCFKGHLVVWGWVSHWPGEHAVLLELPCVLWKVLFQPFLPPSFPAVKSPHSFKSVGPGSSRVIGRAGF